MRIPRGIPQGGDADAPKSGGGARGEPRESGIHTKHNKASNVFLSQPYTLASTDKHLGASWALISSFLIGDHNELNSELNSEQFLSLFWIYHV